MESFQTNPISLSYLLGSIHQRRLALPDFQRDFVWMPRATEQLIESIARSFPAGSLLFYPFQPNTFKPRSVENAPALNGDPLELVLDGQQRLTSLYQAFYRVGDHRYFMDLRRLMEDADVQEAVFSGTASALGGTPPSSLRRSNSSSRLAKYSEVRAFTSGVKQFLTNGRSRGRIEKRCARGSARSTPSL